MAPDLIEAVRCRLFGTIYVMENVPGAPLNSPITLCGSTFGLRVRRHRLFESSLLLVTPSSCQHKAQGRPVGVWSWGRWGHEIPNGGKSATSLADALDAMGVGWRMTRKEVSEAIPPAYTEYLGRQIISLIA